MAVTVVFSRDEAEALYDLLVQLDTDDQSVFLETALEAIIEASGIGKGREQDTVGRPT